jgi:CDGSH-type Zn-finger protein/uncharacterized Fe-S cluster protein YjdI
MTVEAPVSREHILHALYEAAELEHNLMCTYLYAAFSLKDGEAEGLDPDEATAVSRWRRHILDVAIDEMGHLVAVWNITAALGGAPRFGRTNFPLDPGFLPAGVVVKLAPFSPDVLQHFIHLERPHGSREPDGGDFAPERNFVRGAPGPRLTPMGVDYETVGEFYAAIGRDLRRLVGQVGEDRAFIGDPAFQLSASEVDLKGATPVTCLKTALAAFDTIIAQGEGAPSHSETSHFQIFVGVRTELEGLRKRDAKFAPAHPVAHNPVLRRPPRPEGRVWIEDAGAVATVDVANAAYGLMLRLMAYAYALPSPGLEKAFVVDAAIGLMKAVTLLGEHAARLPAGPSHPGCGAGVSFTALRDAAALPAGAGARQFLIERFAELAAGSEALARGGDPRPVQAATLIAELSRRAARRFSEFGAVPAPAPRPAPGLTNTPPAFAPPAEISAQDGVEVVEGERLTLRFEAKRCIHARFCVTGAPAVFLANVQGPWIHPDAMDVEALAAIAHACPSGAISYDRKDGRPGEAAPPVNLAAIREAGPYAFRGDLRLDEIAIGFRATLCRCGASRNKPFCDGSHHDANFTATGEPATGQTDALAQRDGPLAINPQTDGPLVVQGNLEITSGTGRVVARTTHARLCRCGASGAKPFCDGSHARVGFRS